MALGHINLRFLCSRELLALAEDVAELLQGRHGTRRRHSPSFHVVGVALYGSGRCVWTGFCTGGAGAFFVARGLETFALIFRGRRCAYGTGWRA